VRVRVEPGRCQVHTLCSMIAPASFALDDIDGRASAVDDEVPEELQDQVREAGHSCPEQAIALFPGHVAVTGGKHGEANR
jgi:ferredoxin